MNIIFHLFNVVLRGAVQPTNGDTPSCRPYVHSHREASGPHTPGGDLVAPIGHHNDMILVKVDLEYY
jgi:hypothetical protein